MRAAFKHIAEERVQDGGNTWTAQVARCTHPGCKAVYRVKKNGKRTPPPQFAQLAAKKGWLVDLKHGKHICPKHQTEKAQPMPKNTTPVESKPVFLNKPKTPSPREMPVADRRRIFREIDDCYDESGGRYVMGETDETLANRLSVPWGWVKDVREENFGPAGPNPEIEKLTKEVADMAKKVSAAEVQAMTAAETAENLGKALAQLQNRLEGLK